MAVLALERVSLAFDHIPLLDEVVLQIEPGERLARRDLTRQSFAATSGAGSP